MRIVIFSHIYLFAEALTFSIKTHSSELDVTFCQESGNLVEKVNTFNPDIVLVDVTSNQILQDVQVVRSSCQGITYVAMAVPEVPSEIVACANAGFVAYASRNASVSELVDLMDRALKGEYAYDSKIAECLLKEVRYPSIDDNLVKHTLALKPLTNREKEVLKLLEQGLANKVIARRLNISTSTVKNHLNHVFSKLQVNSRTKVLARIKYEPWLM